jgi:transcriptional regulator with XRE-family HTH domain
MSRLVEWRKRRGFSQRALAQAAKVSYVTIARLETGRFDPRLSTLRQLAKVLRVKVRDLLDD